MIYNLSRFKILISREDDVKDKDESNDDNIIIYDYYMCRFLSILFFVKYKKEETKCFDWYQDVWNRFTFVHRSEYFNFSHE